MADDIHKISAGSKNEAVNEDINIETDDDKLLAQKIESRLGEGQALYDAIMKEVQDNEQFFLGNIDKVAGIEVAKYKSKATLNRFYLIIRNMVGMDTDSLPKVQMIPAKDTPPSIKKAELVKNCVEFGFIRVNFLDIITKCLFDTRIKRDSFARWYWDYDKNDFGLEPVMIDEITISPEGTTIHDAEWLVYHPLKNKKWWKDNYPKAYDKINFENLKAVDYTGKGLPSTTPASTGRGSVARFYAYWENDILIEMVYGKEGEQIILKKSKNPYFEYRDPFTQIHDWAKATRPQAYQVAAQSGMPMQEALPQVLSPDDVQNFKPIMNFLSEPRKPFVQFPSMKLLGKFYSNNLMAQGKETLINYIGKKRQIADNLRGCNVKIVVDSDQFSEEEAEGINDEPMQVLRANMAVNPNPVQVVAPTFPELQGILLDMNHDEKYIDDLFGQHDISRGAGNAGTLGQDEMNKESDRTPVRMQSRSCESAIKEIIEGWIQLIKMFYTEKHWVKKLGGKEGLEMSEMINQDVEEGIEPLIVPQSMIKVDKVQRALELWAQKALDPYTLYVELGMPNPTELADRLINFQKFGIISDADPEQTAADIQTNNANNGGDMTGNPVEVADTENRAFQAGQGDKVPPTARELVTKEHVALHFAFYKDPNKKMEQKDMDLLEAHANVDKATLVENMTQMAQTGARGALAVAPDGSQPNNQPMGAKPAGKPVAKGKSTAKPAENVTVNVQK